MGRAWFGTVAALAIGCGPVDPITPGTAGPDLIGTGTARRAIEVSGGTLLAVKGRATVVAADPDRDRLWVVDLGRKSIRARVSLPQGSEPGRLAEDGQGLVFVALRGTGEIATYDLARGAITETRQACAEPRGLTWDSGASLLRVACGNGQLVSLPATGLTGLTSVMVQRDLRDVVVTPAGLQVTTFRRAGLLEVLADGTTATAGVLPTVPLGVSGTAPVNFVPHVAWRALGTTGHRTVIVHQRHVEGDINVIQAPAAPPAPAYYSNTCSGAIVRSALTVLDGASQVVGSVELPGVLPVDVAVSDDGTEVAVAAAGSNLVFHGPLSAVSGLTGGRCGAGAPLGLAYPAGRPTSVAFSGTNNTLVVQLRTPAMLQLFPPGDAPSQILLTDADLPASPGFELFHTATRGIACASCHPEGREDGNTWVFFQQPVRTPSLAGGILATQPFHWKGELRDLSALVQETFVTRMGGQLPVDAEVTDLGKWLDELPRPAPGANLDPARVDRGHTLFTDAAVGCATCHLGAAFTNDATLDVGTGGRFQVPALRGVASRGPWLHDGRAATLRDRFTAAGGGDRHGVTSKLTPEQLEDLTSYLSSL